MALIARTIQQGADLGDESLALLWVGAAELRRHEANQTPQCPAWLYLGPGDRRTGGLALCGANLLAQRGGDVRAKGGRPPVR
jgi:hypothetical protein